MITVGWGTTCGGEAAEWLWRCAQILKRSCEDKGWRSKKTNIHPPSVHPLEGAPGAMETRLFWRRGRSKRAREAARSQSIRPLKEGCGRPAARGIGWGRRPGGPRLRAGGGRASGLIRATWTGGQTWCDTICKADETYANRPLETASLRETKPEDGDQTQPWSHFDVWLEFLTVPNQHFVFFWATV